MAPAGAVLSGKCTPFLLSVLGAGRRVTGGLHAPRCVSGSAPPAPPPLVQVDPPVSAPPGSPELPAGRRHPPPAGGRLRPRGVTQPSPRSHAPGGPGTRAVTRPSRSPRRQASGSRGGRGRLARARRAGQPGPAPAASPVEGELLPAVAVAVAALPGRARLRHLQTPGPAPPTKMAAAAGVGGGGRGLQGAVGVAGSERGGASGRGGAAGRCWRARLCSRLGSVAATCVLPATSIVRWASPP